MSGSESDPHASGDSNDSAVAKTAGFVVASGIAMSIFKALNPLTKNGGTEPPPLADSTQLNQIPSEPLPPIDPIVKQIMTWVDQAETKPPESSRRTIQIVKGDTLWGLSRKYGVSIAAIKEANGLKGDTIYAGKKLIIPWCISVGQSYKDFGCSVCWTEWFLRSLY